MPKFVEDAVRLKLDGQEVPVKEQYTVKCGVLEVPAAFNITVGHEGMFGELAALYQPYTPFELLVGDTSVQVGDTDGYSHGGGDGTVMAIEGRDSLKWLHDTQILNERTFAEKTFAQLTRMALDAVGLGSRTLLSFNDANRKAITGKEAVQLERREASAQETSPTGEAGNQTVVEVTRTLKGEVGTTWLEFLLKEFRKAGLFLWSDHAGNFVLSRPDGAQKPLYRILRRRGSKQNEVTILGQPQFHNDTKPRYSRVIVCGRAGGGKHGRGVILDQFDDDEMIAYLNRDPADRANGGKRQKCLIIRDPHVQTPAQAKLFARRKMAEGRRAGWRLQYTVSGHSVDAIGGGRAIWAPDTTVEVIDEVLGLEGIMYLEGVTFRANPQRQTDLHLMRIDDLVFAEEAPEAMKKRPKLQTRRGVTTVARVGDPTGVPGSPAVWFTDPNIAVGAPVQIDPENETNLDQKTTVTLKPFTPGAAPSGVIHDEPADVPKKPKP